MLTSGLNFGPGVSPRGANNAGNEFNVASFSTGTNAQSAIDGSDYLTFTVQPIAGMAMSPSSVHFTLWRQGAGSAQDYAVYSSIGGFTQGQHLAQAHITSTGAANQLALGSSFASVQSTTSPVEFRLYGWNAATSLDSTHVVAAALQANFTSLAGVPIDPTGSLTVQGDFYHLEEGMLAIDLGGIAAGVSYDSINVQGKVVLEGDLNVSLADVSGIPFAPALGNSFSILTATQGITGSFANVATPQLAWNLDWRLDYLANAVNLVVWSSGDFNHDGFVNTADYVVWRANDGTQSDLDTLAQPLRSHRRHRRQFNAATAGVPEPTIFGLVAFGLLGFLATNRSVVNRRP